MHNCIYKTCCYYAQQSIGMCIVYVFDFVYIFKGVIQLRELCHVNDTDTEIHICSCINMFNESLKLFDIGKFESVNTPNTYILENIDGSLCVNDMIN